MPSARQWLILVYNASMTFKVAYSWTTDTLTMASGSPATVTPELANIQELVWHVTPNENSLETTWLGDSNGKILNIDPHDRIIIATKGYRTGETTTSYYPRFRGYASLPANQNHSDGEEHQYRALGLHRLLETTDTGENHVIDEGQDLASGVANTIISNLPDGLPAGITHTSFSAIGVTNTGKINPGSADLHQNMDALVTLCQLSNVDATWGVKPDGSLFFEASDTATLEVDEGDTGTVVEWSEPQADQIISAIRWVIADGNSDYNLGKAYQRLDYGVSLATADPVTHRSNSAVSTYGSRVAPLMPPTEVAALVPLPASDVTYSLPSGTLVASFVGETQDATPTLSRVGDDDPTSYAVIETVSPTASLHFTLRATIADDTYNTSDIVMVSVRAKLDDSGANLHADTEVLYVYRLQADPDASTGLVRRIVKEEFFESSVGDWSWDLVFGDRARSGGVAIDNGGYFEITGRAATGTLSTSQANLRFAIADFRLWTLDTEALNALAENEYRFPAGDAFTATIQGERVPTGRASITKVNNAVLSGLEVTAFGTRISGAGVQTLITVGPRTPPAISEEHNRIIRRDRLAALAGARARGRRK
jgi:hypothetical protein